MAKKNVEKMSGDSPEKGKISQSQVPYRSLRDALTVPQKITDEFAGHPTSPYLLANALGISPTSSTWRVLSGAAVAYGLTKGAYNADKIALEQLGRRATAPTIEGDEVKAKAEAALKPKLLNEFFTRYNRSKFPSDQIAKNVLQHDFKVPVEKATSVIEIIKDNGQFVGFIHMTKTGPYVAVDDPRPMPVTVEPTAEAEEENEEQETPSQSIHSVIAAPIIPKQEERPEIKPFKVFLSHSKNMEVVDQVKEILSLYDIDCELAVEEETAAIPVPLKIMAAMRRCHAGVMVVTADEQNKADGGYAINNNVLIEIGSAFVLYDQKVVLLWDKRLKVPSNLQGLYLCQFEGNELSFMVGTKLAKALKSFRDK
jgi:predicted nucleotide-binding protein